MVLSLERDSSLLDRKAGGSDSPPGTMIESKRPSRSNDRSFGLNLKPAH